MTARHRISDRNVLATRSAHVAQALDAAGALAPRVGIWDFDIVWNLSIVIWDFSAVFGKANRFYLNQLEADFDVVLAPFPLTCNRPYSMISLTQEDVPIPSPLNNPCPRIE